MSHPEKIQVRMRSRRQAGSPPRVLGVIKNTQAFSLVEVVMALGIVSFTFVALLGLMSLGVKNFENAVDNTVATQIAQSVFGQARQAGFAELSNLGATGNRFYFDEQGNSGDGIDAQNQIYTASLRVDYGAGPGSDPGASSDSASLAKIQVEVKKISAPDAKRTYIAFIANNGT